MNPNLAVFFTDSYFVAAIQPRDRFAPLLIDGAKQIPLFFWIDVRSQTIYNNALATERFEAGDPDAYGNFLQLLANESAVFLRYGQETPLADLLKDSVMKLKAAYNALFRSLTGREPQDQPPVILAFVAGTSETAKLQIENQFQTAGFRTQTLAATAAAVVAGKIQESALPAKGLFAVLEALNANLAISLVRSLGEKNQTTLYQTVLQGRGESFTRTAIVQAVINRAARDSFSPMAADPVRLQAEYQRFLPQADAWANGFGPDSILRIDVTLSDGYSAYVVMEKMEFDRMFSGNLAFMMQEFQQVLRQAGVSFDKIDKIILAGGGLDNRVLEKAFSEQFGPERMLFHTPSVEDQLLKGLLATESAPVSQPLPKPQIPLPQPQSFHLSPKLNVIFSEQTPVGGLIEFSWSPDRKVRARKESNGSFRIEAHQNSSIVTGDVFLFDELRLNEKALLKNVSRNGKLLGNFEAGKIGGITELRFV